MKNYHGINKAFYFIFFCTIIMKQFTKFLFYVYVLPETTVLIPCKVSTTT